MNTRFKEKCTTLFSRLKYLKATLTAVLAATIILSTLMLSYQGGTYSRPENTGSISGFVWINGSGAPPADLDKPNDGGDESPAKSDATDKSDSESPAESDRTDESDKETPADLDETDNGDKDMPEESEEPANSDSVAPAESEEPADGHRESPAESEEPADSDSEAPAESEEPADGHREAFAESEEPADSDSEAPAESKEPADSGSEVLAEPEEAADGHRESPADSEVPADGDSEAPAEADETADYEEGPLYGYAVYLYAADDLNRQIDATETNADGLYSFKNLAPGEYVVGIALDAADDNENLIPMATADDSFLAVNEDFTDPPMAFSDVIVVNAADKTIAPGVVADKLGRSGYASMPELWGQALYSEVKIDAYTWFVAKKETVDGMNCVLLVKKGFSNQVGYFGPSTNYEGSDLQGRMTQQYTVLCPTIRTIAVVPDLGKHSSTGVDGASKPKAQMAGAGSQTKDIMFALSYRDVYEISGNTISPVHKIFSLTNYPQHGTVTCFYLRTSYDAANVYGVRPNANNGTIDLGIHYLSTGVGDVPAVWVNAGYITHTVTVKYIDTNGTEIANQKTYTVDNGDDCIIPTGDIPDTIGDYQYYQWKIDSSVYDASVKPVEATNVQKDETIYLVYKVLERYLVSKYPDPTPSQIINTFHWLANAVDSVKTSELHYIIATENDTDMASKVEVWPRESIGSAKDKAVVIGTNQNIVLKSKDGSLYTISQLSNERHLIVNGSLALENVVLDGNNNAGGLSVSGVLDMKTGSIVQNCSGANLSANTGYGGGAYVNVSGTMTMYNGSTIRDNIANVSNTNPGAGGGVYVNGGSLTLNGGSTISGNIGNIGTNTGNGGGVYVTGSSVFVMSGDASVNNNTTSANGSGDGGGVYVDGSAGTFTMTGGSVKNNRAPKGDGGGIYTTDYDYNDPANPAKYMNIGIANANVSGNTASSKQTPPSNASAFTTRGTRPFNGSLLDNDNINYRNPSTTLTVTKTVTGSYANKDKVFDFSIYFENSSGAAIAPGTTFSYIKMEGGSTVESDTLPVFAGGMATFSLKDGQKIIISGVDVNGKIRIVEDKGSFYDASFIDSVLGETKSNDTGPLMRNMTADRVFDFTNERIEVPPTSVDNIDAGQFGLPAGLSVLALLTGLLYLAARAKYRRRKTGSEFR